MVSKNQFINMKLYFDLNIRYHNFWIEWIQKINSKLLQFWMYQIKVELVILYIYVFIYI